MRAAPGEVACPTSPRPQGHQQPAGPFFRSHHDPDLPANAVIAGHGSLQVTHRVATPKYVLDKAKHWPRFSLSSPQQAYFIGIPVARSRLAPGRFGHSQCRTYAREKGPAGCWCIWVQGLCTSKGSGARPHRAFR